MPANYTYIYELRNETSTKTGQKKSSSYYLQNAASPINMIMPQLKFTIPKTPPHYTLQFFPYFTFSTVITTLNIGIPPTQKLSYYLFATFKNYYKNKKHLYPNFPCTQLSPDICTRIKLLLLPNTRHMSFICGPQSDFTVRSLPETERPRFSPGTR